MKVDSAGFFRPNVIADAARDLESVGYDAVWAAETSSDAFVSLAVAAGSTARSGWARGSRSRSPARR